MTLGKRATAPSVLRPDERWGVIGNRDRLERLQRLVHQGLDSHAFLFIGPRGIGKTTMARAFASALLCERPQAGTACGDCVQCAALSQERHPDIIEFTTAGKRLGIADVRLVLRTLERRPTLAARRIAILDRAEFMTEEAANALLKVLEEPRGDTVLLLTATSTSRLPATVVSRCSLQHLTVVANELIRQRLVEQGVKKAEATDLAVFSDGRPAFAIFLAEQRGAYEQALGDTRQFLDLFQTSLHERFAFAETLGPRCAEIQSSETLIERWESICRRLLHLTLGRNDRGPLAEQLRVLTRRLTLPALLTTFDHLRRLREQLHPSGNARLLLESLFLHLPRLV